jgi:predicted enzyme related to lactoylglutathione lyase
VHTPPDRAALPRRGTSETPRGVPALPSWRSSRRVEFYGSRLRKSRRGEASERPYSVHARAPDRVSGRRSDRALRFWHGVLGVTLAPRPAAAGSGWQTDTDGLRLGVHERGPGPGDTASLPYFTVADLATTLERVRELGGSIIHPGDRWVVCRDSEGSPFALAAAPAPGE